MAKVLLICGMFCLLSHISNVKCEETTTKNDQQDDQIVDCFELENHYFNPISEMKPKKLFHILKQEAMANYERLKCETKDKENQNILANSSENLIAQSNDCHDLLKLIDDYSREIQEHNMMISNFQINKEKAAKEYFICRK